MAWSFFATVTVTAFVMLVLTAAMGVLCYFNYGKGLAHYRACFPFNEQPLVERLLTTSNER